MKEIGIALLGLGNVGGGAYRILEAHAQDIERRLGAHVRVRHVLVKDPAKVREPASVRPLLTSDFGKILQDPEVKIVCELLGGIEPARLYVLKAIESGRHVVTANKALLSEHGEELFRAAAQKGVDLSFEGAVCGGIPVIRTLREALASDRVEAIYGIVNGTTNLILSSMGEENASYQSALKKAQELGFAEADPTFDVSGMDAAQKLCLLTELAFSARVKPTEISVEGITTLAPIDFAMGKEFDYVLKLLATARRVEDGRLDVRVHPAFLPETSPLSEVRGGFNAVLIQSAALGPALLYGQGAGAMPTGSAVVSDVIDLCRNLLAGVSGRLPYLCEPFLQTVPLKPVSERVGPYYLRFNVKDEPGVLARIAGVLGEKQISIASVIQRQSRKTDTPHATIVVFTHAAKDSNVRSAVGWIDQLQSTLSPTQLIRIEEEPPLGTGAPGVG